MYTIDNFITPPKYRPEKTTDWCKDFSSVPINKKIEIGFLGHNYVDSLKKKGSVYNLRVYLAIARPKLFVVKFLNVSFAFDYNWTVYRDESLYSDFKISSKSDHQPDVWRIIEGFE